MQKKDVFNSLKSLIKRLQQKNEDGSLDSNSLAEATKNLEDIGYSYNLKKFPKLMSLDFSGEKIKEAPQSLAESLLWKIGKWKSYKNFFENYSNPNPCPTNEDVVFYAFAMHLKDNSNPIYDQHALRSLWAVCKAELKKTEIENIKHLLLKKNNEWKQSGSGDKAIEYYRLYIEKIKKLKCKYTLDFEKIDQLFMPLGQAIKKTAVNYDEFCMLCGMEK